jgi:DNA-binding transcriptional MerR regulator
MAEGELSFKDMCARYEVTPRTLRYYEYIELLKPRRDGRARWYGPREQARMTPILRGRRFGFPLEDIRRWLDIHDTQGSEAQMRIWIERADAQLVELGRQRDELTRTIDDLKALRDESAVRLSTLGES